MQTFTRLRRSILLLAGTALLAAAAADAVAAPKVGVTAAVNPDARGRPPGGADRVLTLGQNVVFKEEIATDGEGLVQVLLVDGTTFTVGPNSRLTIDEFVYNPDTGDAKVVATVAKGAFRFIGGQTSRKEGGATIRTPAGTIGIRGAMVEGNVEGGDATFSMIFGDEVVYTGANGGGQRLFQPGYTLQVSGSGSNSQVRQRTNADASTFQTALAGRRGTGGGAARQPTNAGVTQSPVVNVNSGQGTGNVPLPTLRTVESTNLNQEERSLANNIAQDTIRTEAENAVNSGEEEEEEPITTLLFRLLKAPSIYHAFFGTDLGKPGGRSLVGSTADSDFNMTFSQLNGMLRGVASSGDTITIPDLTGTQGDNGLQQFAVSGTSSAGPLSGQAFAGRGNFAVYFLGLNGDLTEPVYLITGTGTDLSTIANQTTDIRTYQLTLDPLLNVNVPFFNPGYYGSLDNTSKTDLIVVERSSGYFKSFLTWVDISGTGANQRSAVFVTSGGGITASNGAVTLTSTRRGSFRGDAEGPIFNMRGSAIQSIAGPDGLHAFGPNAENFVVGNGIDPLADTFTDIPTDLCSFYTCPTPADTYEGDLNFGTHHVADLVSETPKTSFSRTSASYSGFMTGMVEPRTEGYTSPYAVGSTGTPNFTLETDASTSQLSAAGAVTDINDVNAIVDRLELAFGMNNTDFGPSVFVDDDTFGATFNGNYQNTRLITDAAEDVANASDLAPGSYMVSGEAAPIDGFRHCEQCDFAKWGWWGTRVIADINNGGNPQRRHEFAHMGTWVAGDITNPADLPTGATNVTFLGTAIANVATAAGEQYIAASSDFSLAMNLSDRSGILTINNLDGADYTALVEDASTATQALYTNTVAGLQGTNGLTGTVNGALVNDGATIAKGTIGQFEASGSGNQVIGTIMGTR